MQRPTGLTSNKLALLLGAWVLVFCATRFALVPAVIPEWFHADDRLDACIKPWQLLTGQRLSGNDTSYIPFLFYIISYRLFDFGPDAARLVTIPLAAVGLAFYGMAFARAFGRFTGIFTLGVVLVTVQFITAPVVPTVTCSAFWFSGPALYILTGPLAGHRVLLLSLLLAASLLSYPAGTVDHRTPAGVSPAAVPTLLGPRADHPALGVDGRKSGCRLGGAAPRRGQTERSPLGHPNRKILASSRISLRSGRRCGTSSSPPTPGTPSREGFPTFCPN